jgi:hypothetical protein
LFIVALCRLKKRAASTKNVNTLNKNRQAARAGPVLRADCDPVESGNRQIGFGKLFLHLRGHNIDH